MLWCRRPCSSPSCDALLYWQCRSELDNKHRVFTHRRRHVCFWPVGDGVNEPRSASVCTYVAVDVAQQRCGCQKIPARRPPCARWRLCLSSASSLMWPLSQLRARAHSGAERALRHTVRRHQGAVPRQGRRARVEEHGGEGRQKILLCQLTRRGRKGFHGRGKAQVCSDSCMLYGRIDGSKQTARKTLLGIAHFC